MSYPLAAKLGKYKHIILIAVAFAALGAYLLPLSTVFAGHNNNNGNTASGANQAARDKITKGNSGSPSTDSKTKTENGGGSSVSSSGSSGPSTGSSKATGKDTTFINGISAQIGGTADNGNIGRGNTGSDNIGIGNSGNGNIGIGNSGNGNIGHHNHGNHNCGNNANGNGIVGNNGNGIGGGKYGGPRGCGQVPG